MSSWEPWLAVAAGGAIGAVARALVYRLLDRLSPAGSRGLRHRLGVGYATLLVNVLGSLALGLLLGQAAGLDPMPALSPRPSWSGLFWTTGVCGSLTTFSTLCAEAVGLARQRQPLRLAGYLLANGALCVSAIAIGLRLSA